jgi:predicted nucleic-acid-binding protein
MIGLDTHIVVRYLAQDDDVQSPVATRFPSRLTKDMPGFISSVVLAEISRVPARRYRLDRSDIARTIRDLLETAERVIENAESAYRASGIYLGSGAVELADALIAEAASLAGASETVTFDRVAPAHAGMKLLK